ncbi:dipeptidase [Gulosibacter faecalis]|jgi:membrane dipeptidase|uniref:Dipeptidase n=1 Tax=Gulosibacter faecalis TaxID=272240 RepID=A0ABW5UWQ8_9MICO|nr:dipeptidase [Gulosibacter faecalis]
MTPKYAVLDGHNDFAWECRTQFAYSTAGLDGAIATTQTDLPRLERGGVGGQFWSVYVNPDHLQGADQVTATLEQIDFIHRFVRANPERLAFAPTAADARAAMAAGKVASLIGVEGGAQFDGSLAVLRNYARLGARYLTLTWSRTIDWADSATDAARHGGLTDFGRAVVRELNRIGVLVDLSHVAPSTMRDALEVTQRPPLVSHSGALALSSHPRNVPDDVLAEIGARDGVVMLAFVPSFLSQERYDWGQAGGEGTPPPVTVQHAADHLDHIREVAGVAAVGLGADYDGSPDMPEGLEDVASYPALFDELESRGWSEQELRGLGCENALRVLEASDDDYRRFLAGEAGEPEFAGPVVDTTQQGEEL